VNFGISTFITDLGIRPAALGRAIEERGFDSLLIAEHSHIPVSRRTPYPNGGDLPEKYFRTLDPFVALAAAASVTERVLLGTGVALVAQRDPIHTAKEVASLDVVSNGRAVFGVGVGWNREEMENHGTDPTKRGRLVNERLSAIRALWTQEKAEFHGEFLDFDPVYSWPKPVQDPYPPIYVGGGEGAFGRVVEFGDVWLANGVPPADLGPQMERLRERAGRDVPVAVYDVEDDPAGLVTYAGLGVERALFNLQPLPEAETLRRLDELAALAATATL
jgi:probable F420-dependent oxidoreductase